MVAGLLAVLAAGLFVACVVLLARWQAARSELAAVTARSRELEERDSDLVAVAARTAHALDAIPQGVVICDDHARIVHRNAVAAQYVAARHGEVLVEAALGEMLTDAVRGNPTRRTFELYGPPRRTLLVSAAPLEVDDRTAGAVAVIDDVSERRRVETMRRDFVANISHELKTPVGALSLLAETITAEREVKIVRRLAERMQAEAERVARTIDDLLELSRIEAEEGPVREPVPVHLIVAESVERVRPAAEQKRVEIKVDEAPARLTVIGDRRQLVSAVSNLLDNAVKYSDDGAVVQVRAGTDGAWVQVAVADHGDGIPARDLQRIFERFYRVDRARSRETGGTGLGLAIVRHVANNHRGEVTVVSAEGEGSTFTLKLPAGPGPVAVSPVSEVG